jgi:hypothetical protein
MNIIREAYDFKKYLMLTCATAVLIFPAVTVALLYTELYGLEQ